MFIALVCWLHWKLILVIILLLWSNVLVAYSLPAYNFLPFLLSGTKNLPRLYSYLGTCSPLGNAFSWHSHLSHWMRLWQLKLSLIALFISSLLVLSTSAQATCLIYFNTLARQVLYLANEQAIAPLKWLFPFSSFLSLSDQNEFSFVYHPNFTSSSFSLISQVTSM